MTREQIRSTVLQSLFAVAPEAQGSPLRTGENLREQLEIDSFDFLQFIIALDKKLGVSIPESDYPQLSTLDAIVEYLAVRLAARQEQHAAP